MQKVNYYMPIPNYFFISSTDTYCIRDVSWIWMYREKHRSKDPNE